MLRCVVLFIFTFLAISPRAFGWVKPSFTASFAQPSLVSLAVFQDALLREGFWSVDATNEGAAQVLGADQIFADSNFNETIYLKFGVRHLPTGDWRQVESVLEFQGEMKDGEPYVLLFENLPRERADVLVRAVRANVTKSAATRATSSKMFALASSVAIPQARAQARCAAARFAGFNRSSMGPLYDILGFQTLATCALTAMQSAKQTALGPLDALKKLWDDPSKWAKETVESFKKLKQFVLHIRGELKTFFSSIADLDGEIAANIACTLTGELAMSSLITAVTGGAAAAATIKVAVETSLMIAKLNKMRGTLTALSRAKKLHGFNKSSVLTEKMMACAIR